MLSGKTEMVMSLTLICQSSLALNTVTVVMKSAHNGSWTITRLGFGSKGDRSSNGSFTRLNASLSKAVTAAVVLVSGPSGTPTILMLLCRDLDSKSSHLFSSLATLAVGHLIVVFISAILSLHSVSACSISLTAPISLDMVASEAALSFARCVFLAGRSSLIVDKDSPKVSWSSFLKISAISLFNSSLRAVVSRLAFVEAASAGADGSLEDVVAVCGPGLSCF